jgi:hypothetical protein
MAKTKPPGTVSHQIFVPEALHHKLTAVAPYGTVDDLIIECITEAMEKRWIEWMKREAKEMGYDLKK